MTTKVTSDGRIVLWQGMSLWAFDVLPLQAPGTNRMHAHHAFQITLAADGTANIRTEERLFEGPIVLIAPDHPHAIEAEGRIALLFVEPESHAGAGLRSLLEGRLIASLPAMPQIAADLGRLWDSPLPTDEEVSGIGRRVLERLLGSQGPEASIDPRIQRVLDWLEGASESSVTAAKAASVACLSESRFSHLFVKETGLPFRTLVLWRRLMQAVGHAVAGESLTAAAHQAGFSDSAHFSRTFHRMFGMPADSLWLRPREDA